CLRRPVGGRRGVPACPPRRPPDLSPAPLDDLGRGLRVIRERLADAAGTEALDWVSEQLARPEPPRSLSELQAELDALVGLQTVRSEEHTSELQSLRHLVCRLLLEK